MGKAQPIYPRGLTFEQVWASIQATGERIARIGEKLDRQIEEANLRGKAIDQRIDRIGERLDRQIAEAARERAEYNKRFGDFSNRFGEIVEYMVAPNLREKFSEKGLDFPRVTSDFDVADHKNNIYLEADVILENGDKVMLVETKTKPTTGDVKEHIKRLQKMRLYADIHGDKRKYLGAVAGVVMTKNVRQYILTQGMFAVEPSGETFNITAPEGQPREW
jgi:hypothetical protein